MTSRLASARRSITGPLSALAFRHRVPGISRRAALIAPGALTGVLVAVGATSRPPAARRSSTRRMATGAAVGAAGAVLLARVIDEVRWRRGAVSLTVDEPDTALDLMQAVRARGVRAEMIRADDDRQPRGRHYAVRYRAKDDRRVRAVLAEQQS